MTAAAFRPHPEDPDERIYRTGDLASIDERGLVFFHGRIDSQIKSRGYRIELGEIETAIHALDDLRESAVVAIETTGFEGHSICCAYTKAPGVEVTPAIIRSALTTSLPSYMLPSRWLDLERLPKNANGKIDRPALRQMFRDQA
jgi:acyl-coenzyme A synthetase/AMP-(fatty) acid ligase